jgi:glycosyltransferase involved in cell wall biosynthesis
LQVAFVVNDLQLSGGVGVVVAHARRLAEQHGMDVSLVLAREQEDPHWQELEHLEVLPAEAARGRTFDVVVSTWWETVAAAFSLDARRHAAFVQSLEDRFYAPDEPDRLAATVTLDLPVAFLTEATWIRDLLADLRPDATCHLVRNGIDKDVFAPVAEPEVHDGPLRILVEGYASTWFKGVNDAIAAVREMSEPHTLTVVAPDRTGLDADGADRVIGPIPSDAMAGEYAAADVVLKLSRVEGMAGPPLEAFHRGATCVSTAVTGHDEYIADGRNALLTSWDDQRGTSRLLDLLARDRRLLHELRVSALRTARSWPSTEQSTAMFALALRRIVAAPSPDPTGSVACMAADIRMTMQRHQASDREHERLAARMRRIEAVLSKGPLKVMRRAMAGRR